MRCYLVLLMLSLSLCTTALDRKRIDSLHALIQTQPADSILADAYLFIGEQYASSDLDSMIYYTRKALAITTDKIKDESGQELIVYKGLRASSLNNIGYAYKKKGAIQKALGYYQQSLSIKEELGLENNIPVKMIKVGDNKLSIDTKFDLRMARKLKIN